MKVWLTIAGLCWIVVWICIGLGQGLNISFPGPGPADRGTSTTSIVYTQSNADSDIAVSSACNGISTRAIHTQAMVQSGAVAGPVSVTIPAGATENIVFYSPANSPGETSWPSGNYLVNFEVVSGNANLTWVASCIFQASSAGVGLHTVGTLTGQSIGLGTAQVNSMIISGGAQTTSSTDRLEATIQIHNSAATSQSFTYSTAGGSDTVVTSFAGGGGGGGGGGGTGTLCAEMQHGTYWASGYSLFEADVGKSTKTSHTIRFQPSKTGDVNTLKWYNQADSHALRNACTTNYGSIQPCDSTCGAPQYRNTAPSAYSLACPNGWQPFATTCASTYSGCYSGGTGGVAKFTVMDFSQNVLATAQVNQPTVTYGFAASYPVISLSNTVHLTANNYYYIKLEDTDPNPSANWWSADSYTPYNLFTAAQANAKNFVLTTLGGKSGMADLIMQTSPGGSLETNFQPIVALGYTDGTCLTQGFAP